jgi:hypothetical protein
LIEVQAKEDETRILVGNVLPKKSMCGRSDVLLLCCCVVSSLRSLCVNFEVAVRKMSGKFLMAGWLRDDDERPDEAKTTSPQTKPSNSVLVFK